MTNKRNSYQLGMKGKEYWDYVEKVTADKKKKDPPKNLNGCRTIKNLNDNLIKK